MSAELLNCNSANYNSTADWNSLDGNVTTVGSNGISSFFGTYDQNGNVWELTDSLNGSYQAIRGGSYKSILNDLNKSTRDSQYLDGKRADIGFRIAKNIYNTDTFSSFITVSGAGNTADTTTYGAVGYDYQIQTYPITNDEYVTFLNAVAVDGATSKNLYDSTMSSDLRGGITRTGSYPNYSYSSKTNMGDKPVNFINWFNAARFVNWISNGALSVPSTTETGVYTLSGSTKVSPNDKNSYWIPNENEWYKAAYYDSSLDYYYSYATQNDTNPDSVTTDIDGNAVDTYANPGVCLPTPTVTPSNSPTPTPTITQTVSNTPTISPTPSITPTKTPTSSITPTITPTVSPSVTPTVTQSLTPTHSQTATPTRTPTNTPTNTTTATNTATPTPTSTVSPTPSKSLCPSTKIGQLIFQDNLFSSDNIDIVYHGFILSGKVIGQTFDVYEDLSVTQTPTPTPSTTPTNTPTPTNI